MTTAADVVDVVRDMLGVTLELEHTGGNCAALAGTLETGHVLVITDRDVLVHSDGMRQEMFEDISAGIYTHRGWRVESEDAIANGYAEGTTPADIRAAIHAAIREMAPAL